MTHDPLHDLLARADNAAPVPAMKPGLVASVRMRARRRAIQRQALLVVGAMVVSGFCIARLMPHGNPPGKPADIPISIAGLRLEIAELDAKAQREQQRADDLLRHASISTIDIPVAYPSPPDPLERVNAARDRAALILLRQADRAQRPAEADEICSSIVRLFPETPAGQIAQRRLKPAGASIQLQRNES